ncbi:MAG: hypothetical protein PUP46_09755 [Endozoicomonas sp. (ex Botrylloides leachii)]|nr:hypothetical protein [Endozoicomonas sp. (ex Botrylloides leachii)]
MIYKRLCTGFLFLIFTGIFAVANSHAMFAHQFKQNNAGGKKKSFEEKYRENFKVASKKRKIKKITISHQLFRDLAPILTVNYLGYKRYNEMSCSIDKVITSKLREQQEEDEIFIIKSAAGKKKIHLMELAEKVFYAENSGMQLHNMVLILSNLKSELAFLKETSLLISKRDEINEIFITLSNYFDNNFTKELTEEASSQGSYYYDELVDQQSEKRDNDTSYTNALLFLSSKNLEQENNRYISGLHIKLKEYLYKIASKIVRRWVDDQPYDYLGTDAEKFLSDIESAFVNNKIYPSMDDRSITNKFLTALCRGIVNIYSDNGLISYNNASKESSISYIMALFERSASRESVVNGSEVKFKLFAQSIFQWKNFYLLDAKLEQYLSYEKEDGNNCDDTSSEISFGTYDEIEPLLHDRVAEPNQHQVNGYSELKTVIPVILEAMHKRLLTCSSAEEHKYLASSLNTLFNNIKGQAIMPCFSLTGVLARNFEE